MQRIILLRGDITKLDVDAIVNAANNSLLGGAGVDGAIHAAAGAQLLEECKTLNGCETGEAKITNGYNLPAKFVIHSVGPVWQGGGQNEENLLACCYLNCLEIASDRAFKTIAFPNISTGVYGFPKEKAALIALRETKNFLEHRNLPEVIMFCCFDEENFAIYSRLLRSDGVTYL